jgi:hypothetical protein
MYQSQGRGYSVAITQSLKDEACFEISSRDAEPSPEQ